MSLSQQLNILLGNMKMILLFVLMLFITARFFFIHKPSNAVSATRDGCHMTEIAYVWSLGASLHCEEKGILYLAEAGDKTISRKETLKSSHKK